MLLDWERFREILEFNSKQPNDNHAQLMHMIDHGEFLLEFLTRLLQELKETNTVTQCVEKYPKAASMLTLASTHPYFSYNASIAALLVSCLIEYSKLDLLPEEHHLDLTAQANKPAWWCITRLRRLINEAQQDPCTENQDITAIVKRISNLIDSKQEINGSRLTRLTDACLGLIHNKDTPPLIEKLVNYALSDLENDDAMHFDPPEKLLSDQFVYQLVVHQQEEGSQQSLRNLSHQWSDSLKIQLLENYSDILEIEILYIVDEYTKKQDAYTPIDTLYKELAQNTVIQLVRKSPSLCRTCAQLVSSYVLQFQDWKMVRLAQCVFRLLTPNMIKVCPDDIQLTNADSTIQRAAYDQLSSFMYNAPVDKIESQRNIAWCVSLASVRLLLYSINALVQWCHSSESWTTKMEHHLVYVNWVVYPTLDLRNSESLADFRSWIQSSQGNDLLYSCLPKLWHTLLNTNALVVACFVISILVAKNVDQIKLLIETVYANSVEHGRENTQGPLYILLDCLYDTEFYTTTTASQTQAYEIIEFVHEKL